jgi:hypothetical protein
VRVVRAGLRPHPGVPGGAASWRRILSHQTAPQGGTGWMQSNDDCTVMAPQIWLKGRSLARFDDPWHRRGAARPRSGGASRRGRSPWCSWA